MNWIIFDEKSILRYKSFIDSNENSGIWHQTEWLDFQKKTGKAFDGIFFGIEKNDEIILAGLLLVYKSKNFYYGYVPSGFLFKKLDTEIYDFFLGGLKDLSRKYKLTFTQIDWITPFTGDSADIFLKTKNHNFKVKLPIPQFTNIIDLSLSLDEILEKMKPKGRYNIKLAEKKGVEIKVDEPRIGSFYDLLSVTTARDGFRANNKEYYELMLETLPNSLLISAYHEGELLASGIFTYGKYQGLYYYGASSNNKRNLMAPYLMQWEAIKIAKSRGCKYYDFMGIGNPDDPKDPLTGVTDFKLKFGENIVKFLCPFHIIHKSFYYKLFQFLKFVRKIT